jgi:isopentenyl diphosphate isomerase/L-lactate dehydrogenase-like FMN-dependent dehydrogenase
MAPAISSSRVLNIADLRRLAKRRLPRVAFDYIDGGADDEVTLRENCRAFEDVTFRPRCAVATAVCDLRTTVLGMPIELPFLLGPVGSCRMFYPLGEAVAAQAAGAAGTVYALSTLSGTPMETVKAATKGPAWYQLYLVGGRDVALSAIERARRAGFAALVMTIDTPVAGMRERDVRNGTKEILTRRPWPMLPYVWQFLARPQWLAAFLRDGGLMRFPNVMLPGIGPMPYADVGTALEQSMVAWQDLRWIRDAWKGPLVIKGVHIGDDARRAVDEGADAVVVSNHGGRQLDGVSATIRALPEVLAAVGSRAEVLMDGGIRRGSDIAKALAIGARAVLIGRAYAYGLGAGGGPGVARAIEILRSELIRTLKLLGCESVRQLDRSFVDIPPEWLREARSPAATAV